jgi:enoyl-CoA hydratase/carnithine racemase
MLCHLLTREDHGKVRCIILNRPPSNNLSLALLEAINSEIDAAESDAGVRAILLGSALPKYFSAGLDFAELFSLSGQTRSALFLKLIAVHRKLACLSKPTLAAIEGSAFLGGFILALGCDWRLIAEETGRVSLSEVRLGLSPTTPLISLVFSMTGRPGLIKDVILKGKTLRAAEAFEAGLVDHTLPCAEFFNAAVKEAEKLAKLPPNAYAAIKRSLRATMMPNEEELWQKGIREFDALFSGNEACEGIRAMSEKRKPKWVGP